ncbi:MAG: DUF6930 domain-containing protein [Planctomycetota bacterium]
MKRKPRRDPNPEPEELPTDWPLVRESLASLPLAGGEVWEVGLRRFPGWVAETDPPTRPWMGLVVSASRGLVLSHSVSMDRPAPDWAWHAAARSMLAPMAGPALRPSEVRVRSPEELASISPRLDELGIRATLAAELGEFESVFDSLTREFESDFDAMALVRIPGIGMESVAFFFAAADAYFGRAPWKRVEGDAILRVECEGFPRTPWFAIVMGQGGVARGLALYEDLEGLRSLFRSESRSAEKTAMSLAALSLVYGAEHETPIPDVDAAEENGWPIAGPEAYPSAIRIEGGGPRGLRAAEVDMLSACLLAVSAFADMSDAATATARVEAPGGPYAIRMAWE